MKAEQPIGIFDSGVGGLTVANAVLEHLPNENLLYYGDTLHFPYGDKSAESISRYSLKIVEYFLQRNCKCVIIACNSASSSAYEAVKQLVGDKAIVINVIDPIVSYIKSRNGRFDKVGIIGTRRTIESNVYAGKLARELPELKVVSMATPLLAPMIEEGFVNDEICTAVTKKYLSDEKLNGINGIALACTHYPLIKEEVEQFYEGHVDVIDVPSVIAQFVSKKFEEYSLFNKSDGSEHHFYVSKLIDTFEKTSRIFFDKPFRLEELNVFND